MENNSSANAENAASKSVAQAADMKKPAKQKKIGLIVGAIIGCLAIVGLIVAAVVFANSAQKGSDPLGLALEKFFNQDERKNTKVDGSVKISMLDPESSITDIVVNLDSQTIGTFQSNSTKFSTKITLRGGQTLTPVFESVQTESGELYIKPAGISSSFSKLAGVDYSALPKNNPVVELIDKVEDHWLLISLDDLTSLLKSEIEEAGESDDSQIDCTEGLIDGFKKNQYSLAEVYKRHPFFESSQDNLVLSQRKDSLYKVLVNKETLKAFLNEMNDLDFVEEAMECADATNFSIDEEELNSFLSALPNLYVEIDGDNNITRLYVGFSNDDSEIVLDLNLSYPSTVNIAEPTEYQDFVETFNDFMSGMSGMLQE